MRKEASVPANERMSAHSSTGGKCWSKSFRHHLAKPWAPAGAPVLVVGDAMLDIYVFGSIDRISPEAPVPVMRQRQIREAAGGAANVAANIVGLGGSAHLVSCVGADSEGDRLASVLAVARVTFDLIRTDTKPTTVKTRFASGHHQLLRLDREEPSAIPTACEEQVLTAVKARIDSCRMVVVSDYDKGLLTDRVLSRILSLAIARGVPTVVDPKRRDFSAYRGATFLKPNRAELRAATGLPTDTDDEIERAAEIIAASTGAAVLVSRSEAGMSLIQLGGASTHMSTHAREIFDVSGAGDTAVAAFALGLASSQSTLEAMAAANLASGIAVSKPGTVIVLANEIEAERSLLTDYEIPLKGALVLAERALHLRQTWKHQGLVVGFTNGCFDLLHPGHVSLLREAARACDRLIVGLNSDSSVRRLKGPERPVQLELARAAVLGAIEYVNVVVLFKEDTPIDLIRLLQPDVLVKGADYKIEEIVGADIVRKAGGRVMIVDLVPGYSTTQLIATTSIEPG